MLKKWPEIVAVAALVAAFGAQINVTAAHAEDTVTFVGWGGEGQAAMVKAWTDPFEKATGIKVIQDSPTDYGKFKAMVESGNVTWDVVDVEGFFARKAELEGLLEPLDYSVIDKTKLDTDYVLDRSLGDQVWSWVNCYNTSVLGNAKPDGWADFFDTKKYPGQRAITKWLAPGILEAALLADGVPADKLYPLDVDRALKKFDTIKKDIAWWDTAAQAEQYVASGEASMGMLWNGRAYMLQKTGAPVDVSWKDNLATADFIVVPKGAKNKEAAMKLIAMIVSPQGQADFTKQTAYGSVHPDAIPLVPSEIVPFLPSSHLDGQIKLDLDYWAKNADEINKRWYDWLAK